MGNLRAEIKKRMQSRLLADASGKIAPLCRFPQSGLNQLAAAAAVKTLFMLR